MNSVFLSFFSFRIFRVVGKSMEPTFREGERVVVQTRWFSVHPSDVVILMDPRTKKPILKRMSKKKGTMYFVLGDNPQESTDSRVFGWIAQNQIIGRVIYPKR